MSHGARHFARQAHTRRHRLSICGRKGHVPEHNTGERTFCTRCGANIKNTRYTTTPTPKDNNPT